MAKIALLGLCLATILVFAIWSGSAAALAQQEDCNESFTGSPRSPEKPELAMASRESLADAKEGTKDIRLQWVNKAGNAACTGLQANHNLEGRASGSGGTWVSVAEMFDPNKNDFLHRGVPAKGEICYRVFAANALGRSEHSNRVCLELKSETITSPDVVASDGGNTGGNSGFPTWAIAVIVVAAVVLVGGGALVMRGRARGAS